MYDEFSVSHISIPVSSKSGLVSLSRSFHTSRSSSLKKRGDNKNGSKINIKRPTTNPFCNGSLTSDKSNKKKSSGWWG